MTLAAQARGGSAIVVAPSEARILDQLAAGGSIDHIAKTRNATRARIEKLLRAELRDIAIQSIGDYAKIQIRRLDTVVDKLTKKVNDGDLAAVDRLLKVFDRLDRYHGFLARTAPAPAPQYEGISQELLLAKIERAAKSGRASQAQA